MTKGSLILLSSVMILVSTLTCRAACPDSIRQQKMLEEEQDFLANMKPGLQHIQMMAVRKAMEGNDTELQQIRQSRNQPPTLPEGVKTFYPRENICLFSPKHETDRKRPILLYLHGGGWCFGSINSCARFCAAVALEADCLVAALDYRLAPCRTRRLSKGSTLPARTRGRLGRRHHDDSRRRRQCWGQPGIGDRHVSAGH